MNAEIEDKYKTHVQSLEESIRKLSKQTRVISWTRVVLFLVIAWTLYLSINNTSPLIFLVAFYTSIGVFLAAVAYHQKVYDRLRFLEGKLTLNKFELDQGENLFSDGQELAHESSLANDLDVFGEKSLFQMLNRAVTKKGSEVLAGKLIAPGKNIDNISTSQQCVKELAPLLDLRQDLTTILLVNKSSITQVKTSPVDHQPRELKRIIKALLWFWPVFSIGLATYALLSVQFFLLAIPLVSWLLVLYYADSIQESFSRLDKTYGAWAAYARLFNRWKEHQFTSTELKTIHDESEDAIHALNQLNRLSYLWSQRNNSFAYFFINTFFLFDLVCLSRYHRWHAAHARKLSGWMDAIGEIETFNSLSTFAYNHPGYTYPSISENRLVRLVDAGHPLLRKDPVLNSITLGEDGNVFLVTGSNMAGKSTFLRAIGLNLILAHAGAPVFASDMSFTPCLLLTSFRQADSVQSGMSYFMAELHQLKKIIEALDTNQFSVVLLDEILRGTNSDDKSHGSEELLKKLIDKNAVSMLATHDLRLGELEQTFPGKVVNYCFESQIVDGDLHFDYKIRKGIARNKNASFLMEKLGII